MSTRSWLCLMSLVLLGGCATTTIESFKAKGMKRASFDLSCPEEQLTATVIDSHTSYLGTDPDGTVGVEGCGKKVVYVNTVSGWVMNTNQ